MQHIYKHEVIYHVAIIGLGDGKSSEWDQDRARTWVCIIFTLYLCTDCKPANWN